MLPTTKKRQKNPTYATGPKKSIGKWGTRKEKNQVTTTSQTRLALLKRINASETQMHKQQKTHQPHTILPHLETTSATCARKQKKNNPTTHNQ